MALAAEGIQVALERADEPIERESVRLHLELLGSNHVGIVAEVSASLAACGVSVEELVTDVREAPMAGGALFEARAVLTAPALMNTEALTAMLEGLADELMVEIRLSED
jgi:glycine cleavage system regulatory protein